MAFHTVPIFFFPQMRENFFVHFSEFHLEFGGNTGKVRSEMPALN